MFRFRLSWMYRGDVSRIFVKIEFHFLLSEAAGGPVTFGRSATRDSRSQNLFKDSSQR